MLNCFYVLIVVPCSNSCVVCYVDVLYLALLPFFWSDCCQISLELMLGMCSHMCSEVSLTRRKLTDFWRHKISLRRCLCGNDSITLIMSSTNFSMNCYWHQWNGAKLHWWQWLTPVWFPFCGHQQTLLFLKGHKLRLPSVCWYLCNWVVARLTCSVNEQTVVR
jgi:hypothetical protein